MISLSAVLNAGVRGNTEILVGVRSQSHLHNCLPARTQPRLPLCRMHVHFSLLLQKMGLLGGELRSEHSVPTGHAEPAELQWVCFHQVSQFPVFSLHSPLQFLD